MDLRPDVTLAGTGPYVFISYASGDRDRVMHIVDVLQTAGISVWIDFDNIGAGANYGLEIVQAIEGCAAFILMCTPAAIASRNVRQEIQLAWKADRRYLPLLLEPTTFTKEIEYWLEGYQWVEVLDRPTDQWLPRVNQAIRRLGRSSTSPTPSVSPAPTPPVIASASPTAAASPAPPAARSAPSPTPAAHPAKPLEPETEDEPEATEMLPALRARTPEPVPPPSRIAARPPTTPAHPPSEAPPPLMGQTQRMPEHVVKAANVARLREHATAQTQDASLLSRVPLTAWIVVGVAVLALLIGALISARMFAGSSVPPTEGVTPTSATPSGALGSLPTSLPVQGEPPPEPTATTRAAPTRVATAPLSSASGTATAVVAAGAMGSGTAPPSPTTPLRTLDLIEVTDSVLGRMPFLDRDDFIRIREPQRTFSLADEINAVVYLRRKLPDPRDLTFPIAYRWQRVGGPAIELTGSQDWPGNESTLYMHTCAPASRLDPNGRNAPLQLEALIEDQVIATFTFRISGGTAPSASANPCDTSTLPRG